jgi:hypothetical protein
MRTFLQKYQIILFFLLTLIIGWFPWYTGRGGLIFASPLLSAFLMAFLASGWEEFYPYCDGFRGCCSGDRVVVTCLWSSSSSTVLTPAQTAGAGCHNQLREDGLRNSNGSL